MKHTEKNSKTKRPSGLKKNSLKIFQGAALQKLRSYLQRNQFAKSYHLKFFNQQRYQMKLLSKKFKYRGFLYIQEWRNEDYAIYSQWDLQDYQRFVSYESIKIRKNKSSEQFGKLYPASESYPTDKSWGIEGFTSKTFSEAKNILIKQFSNLRFFDQPITVETLFTVKGYSILQNAEVASFVKG